MESNGFVLVAIVFSMCLLTTFLHRQVCREWEQTALGVDKDVRLALIRIGVVLGKDGGALGLLTLLESLSVCFLCL